jgi:ATP-dependent helicase HrpB
VVLSTDLAESSVTVEGVGVVVDAGLARRPAYEPATGLSRQRTVLASRAAAEQRAGRAGRTGPGIAYRLWSESEHLARKAWPEPEITTVDLTALVLELAVWGAPADALRWLDPPPAAALSVAGQLLEALGALAADRPTELGRRLVELPLHPRLARMLVTAGDADRRTAGLLAALLSERDIITRTGRAGVVSADVSLRLAILQRLDASASTSVDRAAVATVRRRADELVRRVERGARGAVAEMARQQADTPPAEFGPGPLLAEAYPDRLAQSRGNGRYRLRLGGGAVLSDHDPLRTAEWLVVADVDAPARADGKADGAIRLAAALDKHDVERRGGELMQTVTQLEWDEKAGDLRASTQRVLDALVLDFVRGPATPGPETTAALVREAARTGLSTLGWTAQGRSLQRRVEWARRTIGEDWPDVSDASLLASADQWLPPLLKGARGKDDLARVDPAVAIRAALGTRRAELDHLAPAMVELPNGKKLAVDYGDGQPRAALRVQDAFGTTTHPMVAGGRTPITVQLLSPAGRPIQITADLPGFWTGSWKEVRREMMSRYPKHAWPEDPTQASPTDKRDRGPRRG